MCSSDLGATGALTGQGFGKGALMGAAGAGLGAATQGIGEGALGAGIGSAGKMAGNMLAAGYKPKEALMGGALSGLATGLTYKPADAVVNQMKTGEQPATAKTVTMPDGSVVPAPGTQGMTIDGKPGIYQLNTTTGKIDLKPLPGGYQVNPQSGTVEWKATEPSFWDKLTGQSQIPATTGGTTGTQSGGMGALGKLVLGATALQALSSAPPEVQQAVQQMSPEQQEYFNRPSIKWDWNKMQSDANAQNMSLSQYMASYWPQITSGVYNVPGETTQTPPGGMAMGGMYAAGGGALGAVARLVRGGGSGRDDTVNARLSDGEYVMDAETVAMLGDGSTDAGAKRLDAMRAQLRKHKGRVMAKGKFSPNAKSPLAYLKGAA